MIVKANELRVVTFRRVDGSAAWQPTESVFHLSDAEMDAFLLSRGVPPATDS